MTQCCTALAGFTVAERLPCIQARREAFLAASVKRVVGPQRFTIPKVRHEATKRAPVQRADFELFADYFQFYVMDERASPAIPEDWTDEDVARRVKVAPHLIIVCPIRNMTVPVVVEVHEAESALSLISWDHVVACSIDLPSGQILVDECTGPPAARLRVEPGHYQARILFGGLGTLRENDLEGHDHYKVVLWRGDPRALQVVKQWQL